MVMPRKSAPFDGMRRSMVYHVIYFRETENYDNGLVIGVAMMKSRECGAHGLHNS